MTLVMSNNFVGNPGDAFTGDSAYTFVVGTSATLAACSYGVAVRFPAAAQTIIKETFTGTTGPRVFSRIYRINGTPTATGDIFQIRTTSAQIGKAQVNTAGKLVVVNAAGSSTQVSAAAVPLNTEFRVVYTVNAAGTTLTAAIYPDTSSTTPTETISCTLTPATMAEAREGFITGAGLGAGVTLDLIWPQDDDAADPGIRVYVAASLDITSGIVPKLGTATATVQNAPVGTKAWTFHWGDGTTTGPQPSATASHTYTVAGTYAVTVDLDVT